MASSEKLSKLVSIEQSLNIYNKAYVQFVNTVLAESTNEFEKDKKFPDETLLKLYNVFGENFIKALEIYEQGKVTRVSAYNPKFPGVLEEQVKERWVYQVKSSSDMLYVIYPEINFCTCASFRYQVLKDKSAYSCKHVLAVWLSSLDSEKLAHKQITREQFKSLLLLRIS